MCENEGARPRFTCRLMRCCRLKTRAICTVASPGAGVSGVDRAARRYRSATRVEDLSSRSMGVIVVCGWPGT